MPYKCGYCEISFSRRWTLSRHITRKHSGINISYNCSICKKDFETLFNFETHKREAHIPNIDFVLYKSACDGAIEIYRKILPEKETTFEEGFSKEVLSQLFNLTTYKLLNYPSFKVNIIFCAEFKLINPSVTDLSEQIVDIEQYPFKSASGTITYKNNRKNRIVIRQLRNTLNTNIDDFIQNGSGFILHDVLYIDIEFIQTHSL